MEIIGFLSDWPQASLSFPRVRSESMDKISTLVLIGGSLPAGVTLGFLFISQWRRKEHLRRSPIQGKYPRWPGYSLSKDVEKLHEKVDVDLPP